MTIILEELRESKGMTQTELAAESGVSLAMVRAIENGTRKPSLEIAHKLAKALGVKTDDLIRRMESNHAR